MNSTPSFQVRLLQELQPLRTEGLRTLCAILQWEYPLLQVAYDNLAGETASQKTIALILHLERFERLDSWTCLRHIIEAHFPDRDTSFFPPVPSRSSPIHATAKAVTTHQPQVFPPKPIIGIEWIEIPAGEFWMGYDMEQDTEYDTEMTCHLVDLPTYWIAKTPITNSQYGAFVQATGHPPPKHWKDGQIPQGKGNHPVVEVSWDDGMALAKWAGEQIGKTILLPSEAEWEKAARGGLVLPSSPNPLPKRDYPWGDVFGQGKCNSYEEGIEGTSPVDKYPQGASPYGVLDMSGNVWEWTRSLDEPYPYIAGDGREDLTSPNLFIIRGGSCHLEQDSMFASNRFGIEPFDSSSDVGMRLVCFP